MSLKELPSLVQTLASRQNILLVQGLIAGLDQEEGVTPSEYQVWSP